jgi:hypothetical protein
VRTPKRSHAPRVNVVDANARAGGAGDGHALVGGEVDVLEGVCVAD